MADRMAGHQPDDTSPSLTDIRVQLTLRLDPDTYEIMKAAAERRGRSLNTMINEACRASITPPGGAARIARERRRLPRRPPGQQARAAAAYLMSYLGHRDGAARLWPARWGRLTARPGDPAALVQAGALLAAEFDVQQEGNGTWGTSGRSPSAAR